MRISLGTLGVVGGSIGTAATGIAYAGEYVTKAIMDTVDPRGPKSEGAH